MSCLDYFFVDVVRRANTPNQQFNGRMLPEGNPGSEVKTETKFVNQSKDEECTVVVEVDNAIACTVSCSIFFMDLYEHKGSVRSNL